MEVSLAVPALGCRFGCVDPRLEGAASFPESQIAEEVAHVSHIVVLVSCLS